MFTEDNPVTTTDDELEGSRSSHSDRTPTDQSDSRHRDETDTKVRYIYIKCHSFKNRKALIHKLES